VNKLERFPDALCQLPSIRTLGLADNMLCELPKEFGNLATLRNLYLGCNKLTQLPDALDRISGLEELIVSGNMLVILPSSLGQLRSLKVLNASMNLLRNLPDTLGDVVSLERLYLTFNEIVALPSSLGSLLKLVELDVAHNLLKILPKNIVSLSNLRILRAEFNRLVQLPVGMSRLSNLELLSVEGNALMTIPSEVWALKKLDHIDLHGNCLKEPPLELYARDYKFFQRSRRFRLGYAETMGRRGEMENTMMIKGFFKGSQTLDYLGVFDGHGSVMTAEYVARNLHQELSSRLNDTDPVEAIRVSFQNVNNQVLKNKVDGGCTALLVMITGHNIFIANAGDTGAVIYRNGETVRKTIDHNPSVPGEAVRIRNAGGYVSDTLRVNGVLAVSRSFGDSSLVPVVIADPYITVTHIPQSGESLLVLACDGIWGVLSEDESCAYARSEVEPHRSAIKIRDMAYQLGSTDNLSVVVLRFR